MSDPSPTPPAAMAGPAPVLEVTVADFDDFFAAEHGRLVAGLRTEQERGAANGRRGRARWR